MKIRNAWVAGLLGALEGGLGFLYVGRPAWAVAWLLLPFALVAALGWSRAIFQPWGIALLLGLGFGLWAAGVVLPVYFARRIGANALKPWQRWYVYLGFWVVASAMGVAAREWRGPLWGFETFRIPSMSMGDTLLQGEFIVSDDRAYASGHLPQRGDIVVYRAGNKPSDIFVKRIVGLPGESLDLRQGVVYVDGVATAEPYVAARHNVRTSQQDLHFEVPRGAYFVLGDARDNSNDSRYRGPVALADVIGRVELVWLSWDARTGLRKDRIGARPR